MSSWFTSSRAVLLSIALGVLVGAVMPGVSSLGRTLAGTPASDTSGAAIGVLPVPVTPSPSASPEAEATRPRPANQEPRATQEPSGGVVIIHRTPEPTDDDSVHEGEEHSSDDSDDHADETAEPEPEPEPTDHGEGNDCCASDSPVDVG